MQAGSASNAAGVDVSEWQGLVQWPQVRAAQRYFAMIRSSYGDTVTDSMFHTNWIEAQKAGLVVGAYHFAIPDASPPNTQVAFMLNIIDHAGGYQGGNLAPALDLEEAGTLSDASLKDWAVTFCDGLDAAIKNPRQRTMVYSYPSFIASHPVTFAALGDRAIWIAYYNPSEFPPNAGPWASWTMWQYADNGRVNGIPTAVNLDEWHSDAAGLNQPSTTPVVSSTVKSLQEEIAKLQETLSGKENMIQTLQTAIDKVKAAIKGV